MASSPYYSKGSQIYGQGFVFDDTDADANPLSSMSEILRDEPQSGSRIMPFVGGEELNTQPRITPYRYVMYLSDLLIEADLAAYPKLAEIVRLKVKPERDALGDNPNNIPLKRRWWAYQAHRPELYDRLKAKNRVLAHAEVSAYLAFQFLPTGWVYNKTAILIDLQSFSGFSCLQSRVHEAWAKFFASSLEDRLRYTASDCFETFPFPEVLSCQFLVVSSSWTTRRSRRTN